MAEIKNTMAAVRWFHFLNCLLFISIIIANKDTKGFIIFAKIGAKMAGDKNWKDRLGVVYSTNPDFEYKNEYAAEEATLEPSKQKLIVAIDRRNRGGKQVTLVSGFVGTQDDLAALGKILKVKCGVGGTAKDGEITIQGDQRDKVTALLKEMGYNAKRGN